MERGADSEEVRARANLYIQGLLQQSSAKSVEEIAASLTELAYDQDNPVRELFSRGSSSASHSSSNTAESTKSRNASKFLRLTRREPKGGAVGAKKASANVPATAHISENVRVRENHPLSQSHQPSTESSKEDAGVVPYACIICDEDMSSKGVCKRHIDEQHVSPKIFRCERCGEDFNTKADAKKHCNRCGLGIFTYTIVKPRAKKIYASQFTEEWFASKSTYLEHLLKLSRGDAARPRSNLHCSLRALLSHPSLQQNVSDICQRIYNDPAAWRRLRWTDDQLNKAIAELEAAAVVHENGMIDFSGRPVSRRPDYSIVTFLQGLLYAGTLTTIEEAQATGQMTPPVTSSRASRLSSLAITTSDAADSPGSAVLTPAGRSSHRDYRTEMSISPAVGPSDMTMDTPPITQDVKVKRHLSDESRFFQPPREPPRPSFSSSQYRTSMDSQQSGRSAHTDVSVAPGNRPYQIQRGPLSVDQNALGITSAPQSYPAMAPITMHSSAATSATTLVSDYQEPEFLPPSQGLNYNMWNPGQDLTYSPSFADMSTSSLPYLDYGYSNESSLRTPSIATDRTRVGVPEEHQKLEEYISLDSYPTATGYGTYMLGNNPQNQFNSMGQ